MPEDSKKNDKKNVKEQRKPRQRHQQVKADNKPEKPEESKSDAKVTVPQKPPVYESPPPEFYKNLKRETDEILKITEEENAKYNKKEIQSNWSKYEVPIDTYDEIDEQENLGADYEKLIEASLSSGGHFQFKHEKSWDMNTGPSQYDKYFEINMEDLNIALCTIPFFERNNFEETLFSESDILNMKNRSIKFQQKYFNDKSYSTPETLAHDKILYAIKNNDITTKDTIEVELKSKKENKEPQLLEDKPTLAADMKFDFTSDPSIAVDRNKVTKQNINLQNVPYEAIQFKESVASPTFDDVIAHDDFIFGNTQKSNQTLVEKSEPLNIKLVSQTGVTDILALDTRKTGVHENKVIKAGERKTAPAVETKIVEDPQVAEAPVETKEKTVFESPEDLEKWLDDYLDG